MCLYNQDKFYEVNIGPAGSRAMGYGILGPGLVLDARAFSVPIPKVCTSCRTNIHIVNFMSPVLRMIRHNILYS